MMSEAVVVRISAGWRANERKVRTRRSVPQSTEGVLYVRLQERGSVAGRARPRGKSDDECPEGTAGASGNRLEPAPVNGLRYLHRHAAHGEGQALSEQASRADFSWLPG